MNNKKTIIESQLLVADKHANRLAMAFKHLSSMLPLTEKSLKNISDENLGYLEILTNRFSKLQDFIGSKIFSTLLTLMQEDSPNLSVLDRLHKLEKLEIIKDALQWISMREMRNMLTHDYPLQDEVIVRHFAEICKDAKILLDLWQILRAKILDLQSSLK